MDWLQTLLDNSTAPALTAFLLGLLTAISPCPLATNIAAIGYISKDIENRRRIFRNGVLYTLGRVVSYTILGVILISILKEGASVFGIQKAIGKWGELLIGPLLLLIGLFMLFGHKLNLPQFGFGGNGEGLARKGGMGSIAARCSVRDGFLPYKRSAVLRYADTDVGNGKRRLASAGSVRNSHRTSRACRSLDSRFQR